MCRRIRRYFIRKCNLGCLISKARSFLTLWRRSLIWIRLLKSISDTNCSKDFIQLIDFVLGKSTTHCSWAASQLNTMQTVRHQVISRLRQQAYRITSVPTSMTGVISSSSTIYYQQRTDIVYQDCENTLFLNLPAHNSVTQPL